jgi:hypothetical protein
MYVITVTKVERENKYFRQAGFNKNGHSCLEEEIRHNDSWILCQSEQLESVPDI